MVKIFFIVTAVWASLLMGGISAEKSLHFLRRNDHYDPQYPKLSLDLTSASISDLTLFPTVKPTSNPTSDPTFVPTAEPTSATTSNVTSFSTSRRLYPRGAQLDWISIANLTSYGCTVCYLQTYGTVTTSDNITNCTGPYLFIGGRATASSSFLLGAFDLSSVIHTQTPLNSPTESNGVYWFFTPSASFGFSQNANIQEGSAGTDIEGETSLSWHLDLNVGGYRLGSIRGLNDSTDYMKAIYNCPTPDETNPPSLDPISTPTLL